MAAKKLGVLQILAFLTALIIALTIIAGGGEFDLNRFMPALLILLGVAFISGAPLFSIMLGATVLGTLFSARGFEAGFDGAVNKLFGTSGRDEIEVLSTIPLFIYAGYLLAEAGTADRLVRFANAILGWLPGGLALVTILTCALFTVFTGASGVTIIALGGVLMSALLKGGYPERFSLGLIAGTGSVGLLFPPALPLIIFGTVYGLNQSTEERANNVWDTLRFAQAGILPGLFLVGCLFFVAMIVAIKKKLPRQPFDIGELARSFVVALPELLIPFGVVGLMIGGVFGLPEIAALTLLYVVVLESVIYRPNVKRVLAKASGRLADSWPQSPVTPKTMWKISYEAMAMIGAIFMIILASTALTDFMVNANVPDKMVAWTKDHVSSKIMFLLAINVMLLIVGTVMDIFSAIVVVVPLIAPISREYGIDPYHLGVIFLLNLEVGYLHPPVGLNLFLTSVKFQRPITEVMWATIPFLLTMIFALLFITYVPSLTAASVPPAEKRDPVNNLVLMVRAGLRESKVATREITLVDVNGNELKGPDGKPIVRKMGDCNNQKTLEDGKQRAPTESEIDACQKLFFDATACSPKAKPVDPKEIECRNRATAKWATKYFEDVPTDAVILVKEVTLVDEDGKPFTIEQDEVGPDGKPVKDELGIVQKKDVPILENDKPVTRTYDWCSQLEFASDVGKCRTLFVGASNCKISYEDAECIEEDCKEAEKPADAPAGSGSGSGSASAEKPAGSGSGSGSGAGSGSAAPPTPAVDPAACKANCRDKAIKKCTVDAVKSWVEDNPTIADKPKLKPKK
jgi:C4-dicarboxylate transporter, DctM subunit